MKIFTFGIQPLLVLSASIAGIDRVREGRLLTAAFDHLSERTMDVVHDLRELIADEDGDSEGLLTSSKIPGIVDLFLDGKMEAERVCLDASRMSHSSPDNFIQKNMLEINGLASTWGQLVYSLLVNIPVDSDRLSILENAIMVLRDDWFDFRLSIAEFSAQTYLVTQRPKDGSDKYNLSNMDYPVGVLSMCLTKNLPTLEDLVRAISPLHFVGNEAERAVLAENAEIVSTLAVKLALIQSLLKASAPTARGGARRFKSMLPELARILTEAKAEMEKLMEVLPRTLENPETRNLYKIRKLLLARSRDLGSLLKYALGQITPSQGVFV